MSAVDEQLRRRYLSAMGIELWELRHGQALGPQPQVPPGESVPHSAPAAEAPLPTGDAARLDWPALAERVATCTACDLHRSRTQTVFGVGNPAARLMVVGEAPGAEEDRQGAPFVGRAGRLLDEMLAAIGLRREQVYIANILKCRPPGNRDPEPAEVAQCAGFLARQVELVQPELILAVGRIAAQNLLQTPLKLAQLRGEVHRFGRQEVGVLVTYHPAYLLRTPSEKRKAWQDLRRVRTILGQGDGK